MDKSAMSKHLPRPASGTGEVILPAGGKNISVVWENGQVTKIGDGTPPPMGNAPGNAQMKTDGSEGTDISSCECCTYDGSVRVCWAIRCGSSCP